MMCRVAHQFNALGKLVVGLRKILLPPIFSLWAQCAVAENASVTVVDLRTLYIPAPADVVAALYESECAVCHGSDLRGAAQGTPLVGNELVYGDSLEALTKSTADGFPDRGMPAWSDTLTSDQVHALALFIAEQRQGTSIRDFRYTAPLQVPEGPQVSAVQTFSLTTVADGLDPLPYSIAPLPDGRILVTEKKRGLRIISPDGAVSDPIPGTPPVYDDSFNLGGQPMGLGWMMEVAIPPDFADTGWVYLHYGDRCSGCNLASRASGWPVSMNKVVRGRMRDGAWTDEQAVWQAPVETYTAMPEIAAGGRITFDDDGHVFFSVGMKGPTEPEGVQDLSKPYGKIMRAGAGGGAPDSNPFAADPAAVPAIWTVGHRSPQGLEFDSVTGLLWGTEMGPRGGDEINIIKAGLNYGWPLVSQGVNYDGTPLTFAEQLGITFDPADLTPPLVDLTPAPAVSSFVVYRGEMFPEWQGDLIVGTLRASDLLRFDVEYDADGTPRIVGRETLIEDIARVRDVEVAPDGALLILLEHDSGGRVVRMQNAD